MVGVASADYVRFFLINPQIDEARGKINQNPEINMGTLTATFLFSDFLDDIFSQNEEYIYLGGLLNRKYNLKNYLAVKIKTDRNDIIGEIPELGIYAFGNDRTEVIREIEKDIIELYEELSELDNNKLGTLPKKWKRFLANYIEKG